MTIMDESITDCTQLLCC